MQKGYTPPNQSLPQPSRKRNKGIAKILRVLYAFAAAIGFIGFMGETNSIARIGLLIIAILSTTLLYKSVSKNKVKKSNAFTATAPQQAKPSSSVQTKTSVKNYEIVNCKVAGVTFKNGRRYRQTILRQIRWKDAPYEDDPDITLRLTDYQGQPAVEVWADEEQIGFIPKEQANFFADNWNRFDKVFNFEVHGGGKNDDDEKMNYGATLTARFRT